MFNQNCKNITFFNWKSKADSVCACMWFSIKLHNQIQFNVFYFLFDPKHTIKVTLLTGLCLCFFYIQIILYFLKSQSQQSHLLSVVYWPNPQSLLSVNHFFQDTWSPSRNSATLAIFAIPPYNSTCVIFTWHTHYSNQWDCWTQRLWLDEEDG